MSDSGPLLYNISEVIDGIILDIRYATKNNFTGRQLYVEPVAYLRPEPLRALNNVAQEMKERGLSLIVFDAYRPQSVQKKLRAVCGDPNYVSEVSNHCRGITVDVSLADGRGTYLDMGTDYDDFSEKAHSSSKLIFSAQQANRQLLETAMARNDFVQHPYEWWHFDYQPAQKWDLLNDESFAL